MVFGFFIMKVKMSSVKKDEYVVYVTKEKDMKGDEELFPFWQWNFDQWLTQLSHSIASLYWSQS